MPRAPDANQAQLAHLGFRLGECRCEAWEVSDFSGKAFAGLQLAPPVLPPFGNGERRRWS
jgi:hypothetical protein